MNKQEEIQSRIGEIAGRVEQGAKTGELIIEYTQKWECSARTIARYIAFAEGDILKHLKNKEKLLNAIHAEGLMDLFDQSMLSCFELEAKLCELASGKGEVERLVYIKGAPDKLKCRPNPSEQLKAITLLLRMRGKLKDNDEGWLDTKDSVRKVNTPEDNEMINRIKNNP